MITVSRSQSLPDIGIFHHETTSRRSGVLPSHSRVNGSLPIP